MSLVKVNAIIHPTGSANNITLDNAGNITFANTVAVPSGNVYSIVSGTSQATTSGTSFNYTIPSWAKKITVMFNGVSTSGGSYVEVRLGTSGGIVSSGYTSITSYAGASSYGTGSVTDGFSIDAGGPTSASLRYGHMLLTLANSSNNLWVSSHTIGHNIPGTGTFPMFGGGSIALASALTTVRITTVNGTDTFDAGSVNIMYE